jgi:putative phosphoribosyl transferase
MLEVDMFKEVIIKITEHELRGHLSTGDSALKAWIIFAHGSGSSRLSTRNNWVARELNQAGYGTLLFDLLTETEDADYENRFNIPLIGERLLLATQWLLDSEHYQGGPIAYFGASTGAAAAMVAAAKADPRWPLLTVVSRGGRPDLAGAYLKQVHLPSLLIVGGEDAEVIKLNQQALKELPQASLQLVPGASHLFEESGTLGMVVQMTRHWLDQELTGGDQARTST